jgi:hypothetical protein
MCLMYDSRRHAVPPTGHPTRQSKDPKARIAVRLLDPSLMEWAALSTSGPAPCARGGHSVSRSLDSGPGSRHSSRTTVSALSSR